MASSICSAATFQVVGPKLKGKNTVFLLVTNLHTRVSKKYVITKCESTEPWEVENSTSGLSAKSSKLEVGSPIIILEAPKMVKTAASVPCLRVNAGLIKPGDVGRIMSRKPKDTWAVRLSIGTYLIDGKYFKPLELDENDQ